MKIVADIREGRLYIGGLFYKISCKVRTVKEGARRANEVVRTVPGGKPYDPRPFPVGLWNVSGVARHKVDGSGKENFDRKIYGPAKILTDAWQTVKAWELDGNGNYLRETEEEVRDEGYLLHYSESSTTLGCIRLASAEDAALIAGIIGRLLEKGPVELEVV